MRGTIMVHPFLVLFGLLAPLVATDAHPKNEENSSWRRDLVQNNCPANPHNSPGMPCSDQGLTCDYGQECCCGQCSYEFRCICRASGVFECFFSDFCLHQIACAPTAASKSSSRRRLLSSTAHPLTEAGDEYDSYLDSCGQTPYRVWLYIDATDPHLYAVAAPEDDDSDCPSVITHSLMSDTKEAKKEILISKDNKEAMSLFQDQEALLLIGSFMLSDLAQAYEKAGPSNAVVNNKGLYDIVTNNCGSYLINLAFELGVKIDTRITSFVTRRLLQHSGKQLADRIRRSLNYFALFGGRNLRSTRMSGDVTDKEVIELLVAKGASERSS